MIRKTALVALTTAFASATTPGFACTGISLKAKDGAAIRGRTLEFGFPMQSNVIVIPAGKEMSGTLPDGGKGLVYTSRYAVVGANALKLPVILDGINDQGLSVGLFYFPNYAKYTEVTPENAKHAIAPHEFSDTVGARELRQRRRGDGRREGHRGGADACAWARQCARHRRRCAFLHSGQVRQVDSGRARRRHLEGA
jgi:hypothetical protein